MVTQSSSLSQKRSTIFTSSHALSVTPVVTGESSTVLVTRSFVQSSVSKETTKAQAYGSTVTSLLATVPQSSILIQTESLLQNNSFSGGSVTPEVSSREILTRLTLQSSRVESTEVTSSLEISTTSGVISKRSISVTSRVSSMTLSQPSNIESVLSKPLSVGSAIVTKSPKTLTSSPSQTLTVAASVTSLASTPILTSSLIGSVTPTFQSTVTLFSFDPSSNTFTFLTTSFKSRAFFLRTSAVISSRAIKVTSQISSVTLSLHTNVDSFLSKPLSASSAIVTKSPKTHTLTVTSRVTASVTSLTSTPVVTSSVEGSVTPTFHSIVTPFSFRPSSDTSPETALLTMSVQPSLLTSPRQLSGSRRLPGVTRVYSSRRSQITSTRVIHGSSLSVPTLSSIKTSSLFSSFGKSSEVSVKPTSIISRISTRVSSADFFVSSKFNIISSFFRSPTSSPHVRDVEELISTFALARHCHALLTSRFFKVTQSVILLKVLFAFFSLFCFLLSFIADSSFASSSFMEGKSSFSLNYCHISYFLPLPLRISQVLSIVSWKILRYLLPFLRSYDTKNSRNVFLATKCYPVNSVLESFLNCGFSYSYCKIMPTSLTL